MLAKCRLSRDRLLVKFWAIAGAAPSPTAHECPAATGGQAEPASARYWSNTAVCARTQIRARTRTARVMVHQPSVAYPRMAVTDI